MSTATASSTITPAKADEIMSERITAAHSEYSARLAEARAASAAHHAEVGSGFGLTPAEAVEHHERVKGIKKTFRREHRRMLRDAKAALNDTLRDAKRENRAWRKEIKQSARRG